MDVSPWAKRVACVCNCVLFGGCGGARASWAYNTCGDPNAVDVSSWDGGENAASSLTVKGMSG